MAAYIIFDVEVTDPKAAIYNMQHLLCGLMQNTQERSYSGPATGGRFRSKNESEDPGLPYGIIKSLFAFSIRNGDRFYETLF